MKRKYQVLLLCCAAIVVAALPASEASADPSGSGFVCKIISYEATAMPAYGDHGFVTVNFTSLPDCKGRYLWHGFIYSRGARSRWAHTDYLLGHQDLKGTVRMLRMAAAAKRRVSWNSCPGKQFCISGYSMVPNGQRPPEKHAQQEPGWEQTIGEAIAQLLHRLFVV